MIPASHRLANDKPLFAQPFFHRISCTGFFAQNSLLRILCPEFFARNFLLSIEDEPNRSFCQKGVDKKWKRHYILFIA